MHTQGSMGRREELMIKTDSNKIAKSTPTLKTN